MGNQYSGIGLLNNTPYKVTIGCSVSATYQYANDIQPGQIFFRRPGAVWMTVFVMPTTEETKITESFFKVRQTSQQSVTAKYLAELNLISLLFDHIIPSLSDEERAQKSINSDVLKKLGLVALITNSQNQITNQEANEQAFKLFIKSVQNKAVLYAQMMSCYGGGKGTWLVLDLDLDGNFVLTKKDVQYIWDKGIFDPYSESQFLKQGVHQTPRNINGIKFKILNN